MRLFSFPRSRWLPVGSALCLLASQPAAAAPAPAPHLSFIENKAQWPAAVRFKAAVPGGDVYLRADGFTYDWHSAADWARAHTASGAAAAEPGALRPAAAAAAAVLHGHAVYVDFVGARPSAAPAGEGLEPARHNYFLGSDPARWASDVPLYQAVGYPALYPGVGLRVYGAAGNLKYDFTVAPGASPAVVALRYRGATGLALRPDGTLCVRTSVTNVLEQKPYAYQADAHGQRQAVACRYALAGDVVRYEFPQGYDPARPLVIDPAVVACTYSGSTAEVFGSTAGYDKAGNIYTAGLAQQSGYPVTPGAYQTTYAANVDIGISKLNPAGTALLYATYLGGSGVDAVHSLLASPAGEMYVLAETSSTNFPTTPGAFARTHAAYDPAVPNNNGNDLTVSKLGPNGNALLGSTYLGGNSSDFAGDMALAGTGALYVAGSTASGNFPTTAGAYARALKRPNVTDGFVTRLTADLTALNWSTFVGGTGTETLTAISVTPAGEPVVAGTTGSTDFPVTPGVLEPTFAGQCAYVTRLRADGAALAASTYFSTNRGGTNAVGLKLDAASNVYLLGTTNNATVGLAATPGAIAASTNVFLCKLAPGLDALRFLARPPMGYVSVTANGAMAFGLDACENVYMASFTTSANLPLVKALPNSSPSSGYYTLTLGPGATKQAFGSYYGPAIFSHAHSPVHRFDDQGRLYQVFCSSGTVYTTTPGAYSATNRTRGYDTVVAKIDQAAAGSGVSLQAAVAAVDSACAPYRVAFANNSTASGGAPKYRWNFGDGSAPDTTRAPTHTFAAPGRYRVQLLATLAGTCGGDSTVALVVVKALPTVALPKTQVLCPGSTLTLTANSPGNTYRWSTGATTASISVAQPGKYVVVVSNGRCTARDSTVVRLVAPPTLPADTTGCALGGVALRAAGEPGSTYLWSTQETTASIVAPATGRYTVRVTQSGCTTEKTVNVTLFRPVQPPNVITPNGDGKNDTFQLSAAAVVEPGTSLHIFTRWGQRVYTTDNYRNDWGAPEHPAGLYFYVLENPRFCVPRVTGWLEVVK